jgi:UDP-glucose 4-epimerase
MRILITGGSGFVGSHLCDQLLQQNHEITILSRTKNKISNIVHIQGKIVFEIIDVTNFDNFEKCIIRINPNVIFHLAGETSHKQSFKNPLYDIDVNTKSTVCILETIRKFNLNCKLILGSTFIVIGRPTQLPVNENTSCNPTTVYGTNRLSSEHYCKIYHEVYGIDTCIFRITNSFGPREQYLTTKNALNYLIYKAYNGEEVTIFNNGEFFRDIIYISDVISGLEKIMLNGKSGHLYWISSGKKTWFNEIGDFLQREIGANVKYVESPSYTKKVDVGNFLVDNSKLRMLGWEPKKTVNEGILETLDFFASKKN